MESPNSKAKGQPSVGIKMWLTIHLNVHLDLISSSNVQNHFKTK